MTTLMRVAGFLVLALGGSALAQIDAQSQALLDGLMATQQQEAIDTIDHTMVTTLYSGDTETVTSTRTAIDFVNRRAVIITDLGGGMLSRLVHVDGATTMHMTGVPMALPVPAGMDVVFDTIFDPQEALSEDPNATAVYDGQVSYGDIVSGRQVTYTATYNIMGKDEVSVSRMIFDDAGAYIASVSEHPNGTLTITVFDEVANGAMFYARGSTMYEFKDGKGTMSTRIEYQNVTINEPLDEALFE